MNVYKMNEKRWGQGLPLTGIKHTLETSLERNYNREYAEPYRWHMKGHYQTKTSSHGNSYISIWLELNAPYKLSKDAV